MQNAKGPQQSSMGRTIVFIAGHSPAVPNEDLMKLTSESILEGLDALGDGMSTVVLHHLSMIEGLKKEELTLNVDALAEGLEKMFGDGSQELVLLILKRLKTKLAEYLGGVDVRHETEQMRIYPT